MTALDEMALFLAGEDPDVVRETWRIDGLSTATWAMRKLAGIAQRRAEIQAVAEGQIDAIQRWATQADKPLADDAAFFESQLGRYALDVREADPRQKSVSTPYGTVTTRTVQGEWTVDEPTVWEWALNNRPALLNVTTKFKLGEAKKALEVADGGVVDPDTGEQVPGIQVGPESVRAAVKLSPVAGIPVQAVSGE